VFSDLSYEINLIYADPQWIVQTSDQRRHKTAYRISIVSVQMEFAAVTQTPAKYSLNV